ncbi:hypothetical protein DCS32_10995 [Dokdonia sp. Dokd-P16]|uniref:hypothetical protein n=1 Tax=Dokdonia sp. Dokd-P16 TaxID=2173169 RepID=UPI000D54AB3A|nr:hypothetical protein [Dokdonia sp. Dokd-P16]AWH74662.1 hypothetical protein DCS32_10995 [Dokdonia sp. Dokd-P16]
MLKFIGKICFLVIISFIAFSCETDNVNDGNNSYSKKIIGKWQQVRSFNLEDDSMTPAVYVWEEVDNGFTLQLNDDKSFIYTKFEGCSTGTYFYNDELSSITFDFNCEINFHGNLVRSLTESFAEDLTRNNLLFLMHKQNPNGCVEDCNSILERIE